MDAKSGLPLVAYVRDYYRGEFNNYNFVNITPERRYGLFRDAIMGKLFGEKLRDKNSYISGLIDEAVSINALDGTIKLGYSQTSGH